MPELPEVETVRSTVAQWVLGARVTGVTVRRRDVVATEHDPFGGFSRTREAVKPRPGRVPAAWLLAGDRVASVERVGKQLVLVGGSGRCVVVHLGMSGQLLVAGRGERLPRAAWGDAHDHVVWRFEDGGRAGGGSGGRLVFRDPRRFGGLRLSPDRAHLEGVRWAGLGPDALGIESDALAERAGSSERAVKAALLDQRVLAGVGNIYADEALFRARVHPERPTRSMDGRAWARVASEVRGVLGEAIRAGGSTLRDYTDARGNAGGFALAHAVYGRGGGSCLVCGTTLLSGAVAQRTTVWCPSCQGAGGAHG
ncbi:MAG: bifunctional DNA-formamidopyrimidine glycosylase/DNA-(apurinic or apyrimidinic site) lyase [Planctomycetota bacterium]